MPELGIDANAALSMARESGQSIIDSLITAAEAHYIARNDYSQLVTFTTDGVDFLFDVGSSIERTVIAIAQPTTPLTARDTSYQHGYPMIDSYAGRAIDRGHLIPYTAGGAYGPNLFPQDRALNRGWSREGRQFRALEKRAVTTNTRTLFFSHLIYVDESMVPGYVQIGLFTTNGIETQVFRNRFDDFDANGGDRLSWELAGATNDQIGALGEETARFLLENEFDAQIVAMGDAGMDRTMGRQDLDLIAILDGQLVAFEVKAQYNSKKAGKLTRNGDLHRPRLRRTGTKQRQASQPYITDRITKFVDTGDHFEGMEAQVVVVDFIAMRAQFFSVDDHGRVTRPFAPPMDCEDAARTALAEIISHRGHL